MRVSLIVLLIGLIIISLLLLGCSTQHHNSPSKSKVTKEDILNSYAPQPEGDLIINSTIIHLKDVRTKK